MTNENKQIEQIAFNQIKALTQKAIQQKAREQYKTILKRNITDYINAYCDAHNITKKAKITLLNANLNLIDAL